MGQGKYAALRKVVKQNKLSYLNVESTMSSTFDVGCGSTTSERLYHVILAGGRAPSTTQVSVTRSPATFGAVGPSTLSETGGTRS